MLVLRVLCANHSHAVARHRGSCLRQWGRRLQYCPRHAQPPQHAGLDFFSAVSFSGETTILTPSPGLLGLSSLASDFLDTCSHGAVAILSAMLPAMFCQLVLTSDARIGYRLEHSLPACCTCKICKVDKAFQRSMHPVQAHALARAECQQAAALTMW